MSQLLISRGNSTIENSNKKEAYYCKHVTALFHKLSPRQALLGDAPSKCQVPARDYSITFEQEPRSFEIRKNKQHNMYQRGSPGTPKRIFLGVITGGNPESAYRSSEWKFKNKVIVLPTAYCSILPPKTYQF